MCHILFQVYACDCKKVVCLTPCPHALKTGCSRCLPTSHTQPCNSNQRSQSEASSPATSTSSESGHTIPRRPIGSAALLRNDSLKSTASTSTASSFGPSSTRRQGTAYNPESFSRPAVQTAETFAETPSPVDKQLIENSAAVHCEYYFPRELTPSRYPCLNCYMKPEWTTLQNRWIQEWRFGHPMDKPENMDYWSGVELIPKRVGLLNVFAWDAEKKGRDGEEAEGREQKP